MNRYENFTAEQQVLYARYRELNRFAKIIMQLCSIILEPTDVSTLLRCLYHSTLDTEIDRQDFPRQINLTTQQLMAANLLTQRFECAYALREIICQEALSDNTFQDLSAGILTEFGGSLTLRTTVPVTPIATLRKLRIDIYNGDFGAFHHHLIDYYTDSTTECHPIVTICNNPFSSTWFSTLPDHVQLFALHEILKDAVNHLYPIDSILTYLSSPTQTGSPAPIDRHCSFLYLYITALLFQGKLDEASTLLTSKAPQTKSFGLKGWLEFLLGHTSSALESFAEDLTHLQKINDSSEAFFTGFEGVICCLAHLQHDTGSGVEFIQQTKRSLKALQPANTFRYSYDILGQVGQARSKRDDFFTVTTNRSTNRTSIDHLMTALGTLWIESRLSPPHLKKTASLFSAAQEAGFLWLAREFAEILFKTSEQSQYQDYITWFNNKSVSVPLVSALPHELPWKRALRHLQKLTATHSSLPTKQSRLVWYLRPNIHNQIVEIIPKLQKINLGGQWSQGRSIVLNKLTELQETTFLSDQDKQICATLTTEKRTKNGTALRFDLDQALIAMIDHPHVYALSPYPVQVEIIRRLPDLHIQHENNSISLYFLPYPEENQRVITLFESKNRLGVYSITPELQKIAETIGPFGLQAPAHEKNAFFQVLGNLASHCNIHTNVNSPQPSLEMVEADTRIYCQLSPIASGFHISLLTKPFADVNRYFKPGEGAQVIISKIEKKTFQIIRNLQAEESAAQTIEETCPSLSGHEDGSYEWNLEDLGECLQFLEELQLQGNAVVVEWPKGKRLKILKSVQANQMMLKIHKHRNWFEMQGELRIDEETVLSISDLLSRFRQSTSNFIQLTENTYISLSAELQNYFNKLRSITWNEGDTIRFSPQAALLLNNTDLPEEVIHTDQHWHELQAKIVQAALFSPQLPVTLTAELRTYQKEGFDWLSRLSFMGFGACLADEMGLGKTLQALAFILSQAEYGPTLVIAPTSVCFNWRDEAEKFTPSMKTLTLPTVDRKKTLSQLTHHDLLITSYGLLQQEQELFSEVNWQTIILDEAQAIKNMSTKRFKAALTLQGKHKIVTTGTPLENNLGELWSIFHFINPGLLGSISLFNKRFAGPIEKNQDVMAQKELKKIVTPFILRRLKNQVLDELPPRTEVNLQVQLSEEEKALYEAYRRQALEHISNTQTGNDNRQIKILAEIMRLRRLCCNPNLIAPELKLQSSKLAVFDSILGDLLESGHKVLVFSQFVDHLKIIQRHIENKSINYQYLDGSTPTAQRRIRVQAFQAGEGDVFLISLKAGGLGLNLTAANYVIHMDPWWNPAVEDQASDRVHRIGQKHPVTVYRLITQDTIEEKIVELHQHKRDLADTLLEGTEFSNKISADELIAILGHEV